METEEGRLERMYAELGNEHLLDLKDDAADLTDEARLVLFRELRKRGLVRLPKADPQVSPTVTPELEEGFGPGIPGVFPAGAAIMEQALPSPAEDSKPRRDGLTRLIAFYDGIELGKACEHLEGAEMQPLIEAVDGDQQSSVPPRFEVWLHADEIEPAQALLRAKMGLFPLAEGEGDGSIESGDGVVGSFDSEAEAEEARQMLTAAGINGYVRKDVDEESDAAAWELTVAPGEQERAIAVVAAGMGLG